MLRVSSQNEGFNANLKAVTSENEDSGVLHSNLLRKLTESTILRRWDELDDLRKEAIDKLGVQATIDALSVASGFNGITRVADATGIPIDPYEDELGSYMRSGIGVNAFHYSEKSARYG